MLEYINLVPHTNSILFSSLLVALLCGVTLPQGFNYLHQHNFQLNIFSVPIFFHLFFIWKNKTLTYLSRSSTHAFLPPTDLMPLLPHWSVSSLSLSLSFSLIDHHCWWVSHYYHFLTVSLFIHIHFSRLPVSFLHVVTLELLFCVSIQIKYEWGLRFFFP